MSEIPFFGLAVHAVLPFFVKRPQYLKKSFSLGPRFSEVLNHFNEVNQKYATIPSEVIWNWEGSLFPRVRILRVWNLIGEAIQEYDEVWIEPNLKQWTKPGEQLYMPDLVLLRGKRLIVADIKTGPVKPEYFVPGVQLSKQIGFAARILKQYFGSTYEIAGRGFIFENNSDTEPYGIWIDVPVNLDQPA